MDTQAKRDWVKIKQEGAESQNWPRVDLKGW